MKDINLLKPYVAYLCNKFLQECKNQGLTIKILETLRTQERQTELHIENPAANPKFIGPHGYGLAFDAIPLNNGKVDWTAYDLFKKMGAIGKSVGLEWGGDWKKVDCPHFQYTQGLKDSQIRAGKLPNFPPIPKEEFNLMNYKLQPIAEGMLFNTFTLTCCSKPSNSNKTASILKKGINEPVKIYAKVHNEDRDWYLVNPVNEQWVAAHYIKIKE